MAVNCQQRRRQDIANKQTLENRLWQNHNHQPLPEREIKPVWGGKKWSHVCLVWRCWLLGFGVMWCCAVMFPEEGLDLLTACLQTVGGRHLLQQFHHSPLIHFSPYSYPFPLLGKQLSTSGSIPGFIKLKRPLVVGWLLFPSCLFHFGIVRLAPTGRTWDCHRAHFSWEAGSS